MIERLLALLERFVVAQEKAAVNGGLFLDHLHQLEPIPITGSPEPLMKANPAMESAPLPTTNIEPPANTSAEFVQQSANEDERKVRVSVIAELQKRNIPFKAQARTETLKKMLAEAQASGIEMAPPASLHPISDAMQTKAMASPKTKDEARSALMALAALKGDNAGISILRSAGRAESLGKTDPAMYGAIVAECERQIAEARNESKN